MKQKLTNSIVPNPMQSEEQWLRYHHFDIAERGGLELWRESWSIDAALASWPMQDEDGLTWLLEHKKRIKQERDSREREQRHHAH